MENIKSNVIESMKAAGAEFLASTTAWDIHGNRFGKKSNVAKEIKKHELKSGESFIVVCGAKGRSQHSASEVLIFKNNQSNRMIGSVDVCFRDYWVMN